ncbi:ubiquitin-like autophagy protein Apg12-domain-containing protein [Emericellopsis atlantica]|uniref:Ubiquitin-like protein ATG12 n=1 Tax=Emericellopsis atlantica TaxID=2614577 RepID=A0A9P7ZSB8_9HYPO|nr:ubiquitin-like autophagy protein Apg12-domain-containing protein [Emericellopsis atlantica]KAG9256907.1 ubiquitin-like autophagy protein Apg12-domain-containing protein [Emericellopsis atlantica]
MDPQASPAPIDSPESPPSPPSLPLTLSASVQLQDLDRDASLALATAAPFASEKVVVRFKPVGAAPALSQDICKITSERRFEEVVRYLRRKLKCKDTDSVFLYVNSAFAPSLDEVVGNLHQCFKDGRDQLVVAYSMTPAFG